MFHVVLQRGWRAALPSDDDSAESSRELFKNRFLGFSLQNSVAANLGWDLEAGFKLPGNSGDQLCCALLSRSVVSDSVTPWTVAR